MCYVHNQWYDVSCATLYMKGHAQEQAVILTSDQPHLCRFIRFSIDQSIDTTGSV